MRDTADYCSSTASGEVESEEPLLSPSHCHSMSSSEIVNNCAICSSRRQRHKLVWAVFLVWTAPLALAVGRSYGLWGSEPQSATQQPDGQLRLVQVCVQQQQHSSQAACVGIINEAMGSLAVAVAGAADDLCKQAALHTQVHPVSLQFVLIAAAAAAPAVHYFSTGGVPAWRTHPPQQSVLAQLLNLDTLQPPPAAVRRHSRSTRIPKQQKHPQQQQQGQQHHPQAVRPIRGQNTPSTVR